MTLIERLRCAPALFKASDCPVIITDPPPDSIVYTHKDKDAFFKHLHARNTEQHFIAIDPVHKHYHLCYIYLPFPLFLYTERATMLYTRKHPRR